jgi:hypothetical protein
MKKHVLGLIVAALLLWSGGRAFAQCASGDLAACPSPNYNAVNSQTLTSQSAVVGGNTTINSNGIAGSTVAGGSVPTGYIGEQLVGSATGVSVPSSAATDITSITLSPGHWICGGSIVYTTLSASVGNIQAFFNSTPNTTTGALGNSYVSLVASSAVFTSGTRLLPGVVVIFATASSTLYLEAWVGVSATGVSGSMYCVRIS